MYGAVDAKSPVFSVFIQSVLTCATVQMVSWWLLVWRVVFIPSAVCMGFVVNEVVLGHIFIQVRQLSLSVIPLLVKICIRLSTIDAA
jgi:hypothetical protein